MRRWSAFKGGEHQLGTAGSAEMGGVLPDPVTLARSARSGWACSARSTRSARPATTAVAQRPIASGGGVLMDMLHGVYLAEHLLGEPVTAVSAFDGMDGDEPSTFEGLTEIRASPPPLPEGKCRGMLDA